MSNQQPKKRKRATRKEMMERLEAKLALLQAQEEGKDIPEEAGEITRIKAALKKRRTELKRAQTLLNGRPATEKSPAVNGIDEKIENAQSRLDQLLESKNRATEIEAHLPFDISRLETLLEEAEKGEEVSMPNGLYQIGKPENRTDREHEVAASMENDPED